MSSALRACSNTELLSSLDTFVRDERRRVVEILRHLGEVDRRRLYLELGYRSLFDYCVSRLRYSESGAGRRVAVTRVLHKFPEVGAMLESGEASLMSIAMVARLLTPANAGEILEGIRGKSKRDVEALVSGYRPETVLRDRVRKVCVKAPAQKPLCGSVSTGPRELRSDADTVTAARRCTGGSGPGARNDARDSAGAAPPETADESTNEHGNDSTVAEVITRTLVQFAADDAFMEKVNQVRALLSHKVPGATFAQVFDATLEAFLDANCPQRREARRQARRDKRAKQERRETRKERCREQREGPETRCGERRSTSRAKDSDSATTPAPCGYSLPPVGVEKHPAERSRHIPATVRDRVFTRDGGRCAYVGSSGRRCGATQFLQVDHIVPFARGGGTSLSNLRLLCGEHNRLMAKRCGLGWTRIG